MRIAPLKAVICAAAVVAAISCGSGGANRGRRANTNSDESQNPPVTITVAKSEVRDVPATIDATGTLVAAETSDVAPKVAGKISNIYANVGQFVAGGSLLILVRPELGVNSFEELLALAKSRKDGLTYGSQGPGSLQHVIGELLQREAGFNWLHIPFKGGSPALAALLGGQIDCRSIPGEGTTFTISLPLTLPVRSRPHTRSPKNTPCPPQPRTPKSPPDSSRAHVFSWSTTTSPS